MILRANICTSPLHTPRHDTKASLRPCHIPFIWYMMMPYAAFPRFNTFTTHWFLCPFSFWDLASFDIFRLFLIRHMRYAAALAACRQHIFRASNTRYLKESMPRTSRRQPLITPITAWASRSLARVRRGTRYLSLFTRGALYRHRYLQPYFLAIFSFYAARCDDFSSRFNYFRGLFDDYWWHYRWHWQLPATRATTFSLDELWCWFILNIVFWGASRAFGLHLIIIRYIIFGRLRLIRRILFTRLTSGYNE